MWCCFTVLSQPLVTFAWGISTAQLSDLLILRVRDDYFFLLIFPGFKFWSLLCPVTAQGKRNTHEENGMAKSLVRSGREATASRIGSKKLRKKRTAFRTQASVHVIGQQKKTPLGYPISKHTGTEFLV